MVFYWVKKRKLWVIKAIDRSTWRTVAWVLGNRDSVTFRRLYKKVKHLINCTFYTDYWDAFKVVSRLKYMVDITLRIWHAITTTDLFYQLQEIALSIYQ